MKAWLPSELHVYKSHDLRMIATLGLLTFGASTQDMVSAKLQHWPCVKDNRLYWTEVEELAYKFTLDSLKAYLGSAHHLERRAYAILSIDWESMRSLAVEEVVGEEDLYYFPCIDVSNSWETASFLYL